MKHSSVAKERTTIAEDGYVLQKQASLPVCVTADGHDAPTVIRGSESSGRGRLRRPRLHAYMSALFLLGSNLVAAGGSAPVVELSVDSVRIAADQEAVVSIRALPPNGIVAAAFSLHYDTESLEFTGWEAPLFPAFTNQFDEAGDESLFGDRFESEGIIYEQPVVVWIEDGEGLRMAGIRLVPAGPGEDRLFDLSFRLAAGATPGFYPVHLVPTMLTATHAGYPADGQALDPLLSLRAATPEQPDPEYPPLLTADALTAAEPTAWLTFFHLFSDTSGSGLDDAWEIAYFGATNLTDALADFDSDGWVNLLEYFHGGNPTVPSSVPPMRPVMDGDRLLIRFPMAPTVLDFELETATAAMAWSPMPSGVYSVTPRPDLGQTDAWTMIELAVPLPEAGSCCLYRLRVRLP